MIDIVIINPGDRTMVYQGLSNELAAIEQPTFALLVARYLMKLGYTVKVIDVPATTMTNDEVAELVEEYDPTLVAFYIYGYQPSASTQNMPSTYELCTAIKKMNRSRKIMLSGTHPSALPAQTLQESGVEFVCSGEGFITPKGLIDHIKSPEENPIEKVQDLWYWNQSVTPTFTFHGNLLSGEELDKYCDRPAWELVDMSVYRSHNWHAFGHLTRQPYASLYSSLGCPFKCSFCCINSPFGDMLKGPRPYRLWSPEVIIEQIGMLVEKYGVYNIKFVDEMFVLNREHVLKLCDLIIERGYKVNIWAYARVDSIKDEFLDKLKKAGFNWLALGIESGSKHVRDGANKKYGNDDIINVVKKIREHGIYTIGNYIFGLPDDDFQSMEDTLQLALELKCEFANFYSAMAYPGSPLYHQAIKEGWNLPKSWIGYSQHSYTCLPLPTEVLSSKEVLKFRDEAFIRYFSDEGYLNLVRETFGQPTVDSIKDMLKHNLKRKIFED